RSLLRKHFPSILDRPRSTNRPMSCWVSFYSVAVGKMRLALNSRRPWPAPRVAVWPRRDLKLLASNGREITGGIGRGFAQTNADQIQNQVRVRLLPVFGSDPRSSALVRG